MSLGDIINDMIDDITGDSNYESRLPDSGMPNQPLNLNHPLSEPLDFSMGGGLQLVTDIFGNTRLCDPMEVDIFSGIPCSEFDSPTGIDSMPDHTSDPSFGGTDVQSVEQMKLDQSREMESMRDTAVQHYQDAKASGDLDEMLKWEAEANKQQGRLYDLWGTPTYGLPPKAPGIS